MTDSEFGRMGKSLSSKMRDQLRRSVKGIVVFAEDADFDESRKVWNAAVDREPAAIVRCSGAPDVVEAVSFAARYHVPIAVRGGGHNVAGSGVCDDGLLIDTSAMKEMSVDPIHRAARAEAGLTWADFDRQTQAVGLATTGGICSETGIAGVTLGAGFGWLMRKYGTSIDNLLSFDIVTADGMLRRASANENADLFFAVRGSQSNFGVVTSFEFQLHQVGPVLAGMLLYPLSQARDVLGFFRDFTASAPEELGSAAVMLTGPDGNRAVALLLCYHGDLHAGEEAVAQARAFGPPIADLIRSMPYTEWQSAFDQSFPRGRHNYWKSGFLTGLDEAAIDGLVDGFKDAGSPYSTVLIEHLGGNMRIAGNGDAAFEHRDNPYNCVIMPMWTESRESNEHIRWADNMWASLGSVASRDVYVNYLGNEGPERTKAAYGRNYERLRALKAKYDPENLFRFNQNIV